MTTTYMGVKTKALFDSGDGSGFFIGARTGLHFWDLSAHTFDPDAFGNFDPRDDDGTDYYIGAFGGYQFSPKWSVSVNYDHFETSADNVQALGVGVEFNF